MELDPIFILLAAAGVALAVVVSIVMGTLTARLFFRASRGELDEAADGKREAIR